jgi:NADPH:quinone reductase-like Zn-dependent oxidoreductase
MSKQEKAGVRLMRAIVTDPHSIPGLIVREVPVPVPAPNQALIKVKAFSLNQGETRTALDATESYIPGWDFAGVVEVAATNGSTPKKGTRVFGYIGRSSWAEYLIAPGGFMAEIPEGVSDIQAATLPIAGLTAMACIDASGVLLDRSVLVTGASGGVGRFACKLAQLAGAKVFAVSRRSNLFQQLQQDGINPAGIFASAAEAKGAGAYDVIWDSVGGDSLAIALTSLARNGICVNYGNSSRQPTTFDVRTMGWPFHGIQCVWLGREPLPNSTPIFDRLARLVQQRQLHAPIDTILPWTSIAEAAERLIQQHVDGKIVLEVV